MGLISKAIKSGLALKALRLLKKGYQNYKSRKSLKNVAHHSR